MSDETVAEARARDSEREVYLLIRKEGYEAGFRAALEAAAEAVPDCYPTTRSKIRAIQPGAGGQVKDATK